MLSKTSHFTLGLPTQVPIASESLASHRGDCLHLIMLQSSINSVETIVFGVLAKVLAFAAVVVAYCQLRSHTQATDVEADTNAERIALDQITAQVNVNRSSNIPSSTRTT